MLPCTHVLTHGKESSEDELFSDYSARVCHHGGKTASLQNYSDTHHSLQKALDCYTHTHTHISWLIVKLLTEQSEAETETKTVQLWKELWL